MSPRDARFDGRFFTGVKTTGIYCRPICPARTPRAGERAPSIPTAAAAQEAGFRPCLRCRPETAPDLGAWRGTSNTVSRALALIERGAWTRRDVDDAGRTPRRRRAPAAAPVPAAPRRLAGRGRPDAARPARQAADPRDAPCRWPRSPSRRDSAACAASTRPSRRCSGGRRARCGWPSGRDRSRGGAGEIELLLRYQPPYDWRAMLLSCAARAIAGVERVTPSNRCRARCDIGGAARAS